jgi:hypothetical protein
MDTNVDINADIQMDTMWTSTGHPRGYQDTQMGTQVETQRWTGSEVRGLKLLPTKVRAFQDLGSERIAHHL